MLPLLKDNRNVEFGQFRAVLYFIIENNFFKPVTKREGFRYVFTTLFTIRIVEFIRTVTEL